MPLEPRYAKCPLCSWYYTGLHAEEHYEHHLYLHHKGEYQMLLSNSDKTFLRALHITPDLTLDEDDDQAA